MQAAYRRTQPAYDRMQAAYGRKPYYAWRPRRKLALVASKRSRFMNIYEDIIAPNTDIQLPE